MRPSVDVDGAEIELGRSERLSGWPWNQLSSILRREHRELDTRAESKQPPRLRDRDATRAPRDGERARASPSDMEGGGIDSGFASEEEGGVWQAGEAGEVCLVCGVRGEGATPLAVCPPVGFKRPFLAGGDQ